MKRYDPKKERKDLGRFARLLGHQFCKDYVPVLEDLSNKRLLANQGRYSHVNLQIELLRHIIWADAQSRKCVQRKKLIGKALRRLRDQEGRLDQKKRAQSHLEYQRECEDAAKWVIDRLRSIGDGIAWRILNYDRVVLRLLVEHEWISPPQLGRGTEAELERLLQLATEEECSVLLNSVTNFVRVGDITRVDESTGRIALEEVKAGRRISAGRIERQGQHMVLVQEGLDADEHSVFGGVRMQKLMADNPLKTYVPIVERAIEEARSHYVASRLFGDYLSVGIGAVHKAVVDGVSADEWSRLSEDLWQRLDGVARRKTDALLPQLHNWFHLTYFPRTLAPYVIFPMKPRNRLDLLTGRMLVISVLNVSGLERWLRKRGWKTKLDTSPLEIPKEGESHSAPVLQVFGQDGKGATVDLSILTTAASEFWMPESIEAGIATAIEQRGPVGRYYQMNFPNVGKWAWD